MKLRQTSSDRKTSSYMLLAQRIPYSTRFVLTVVRDGTVTETITAMDAQLILDYVRREWPAGTRVQWVIA